MNKTFLIAIALAGGAALPAHAVLATDAAQIGNAALIDFDGYDGLRTTGPEALSRRVTFNGDAGSELGAFVRDLGDNGAWGAGERFAAGGFSGELRFRFDGTTRAAGAFVNHYAGGGLPFALAVTAYGLGGEVLETHTVTVDTAFDGYNDGLFVGIARAQRDIQALSFKGSSVVLDDFAHSVPVPEAGRSAMLLAGLGMVGLLLRRRPPRG
ncbi:MAG: PEP-CTERM sorting domain-containing protein [Burkholderiales bacterium]|nr:PEP-CTERM sorting domain-containing protein [Burkholderiales bacterium]